MKGHRSPFLYDGLGLPLRHVQGAAGNQPVSPDSLVIPNLGYSEAIGAHDATELQFYFKFGAPATGDLVIERGEDINFPNDGRPHDTLTVADERAASWNAGMPLIGFFRIKNASGQTLQVFCQKRI